MLPPDPAVDPGVDTTAPTETPAPVLKARWRDRVWSFRAMLAVALATLVLGGIVGGTIGAVAAGGDDDRGLHRMGPGRVGPGMPGWRGRGHFQGGGPGFQWNDGPQPPPGGMMTPYGPPTPSPTPSP